MAHTSEHGCCLLVTGWSVIFGADICLPAHGAAGHAPILQVYAGLVYKLSLSFPSDYPCAPPVVRFETPCYHPNVDQHGNICLDILKVSTAATLHAGCGGRG